MSMVIFSIFPTIPTDSLRLCTHGTEKILPLSMYYCYADRGQAVLEFLLYRSSYWRKG